MSVLSGAGMPKVIWLGRADEALPLRAAVNAMPGLELMIAADVDSLIGAARSGGISAAIVAMDWGTLAATIRQLRTACPELQVLMATRLGVPHHVSAALEAGVVDLLDLKSDDPAQTCIALGRALARHAQSVRERQLLFRLRDLNEDFLKTTVQLDKRNMQIEQSVLGDDTDDDARPRVLVIDDEPAIADLVKMILEDRGYDVTTAGDGAAGVALAHATHFHIVITDKNLPGMDGHMVLREIKRLPAETDVVIITGYSSKESVLEALHNGASAYLEKPFDDIEIIGRKIDEVMTAQRERRKRRDYLRQFKQRNREFLEQYRTIRADLEAWLSGNSGA